MNQFDQFQVIGHISPVTVGLNTTPPVSEVIDSQGFSGGRCIIFLQTGNMGRTTTKCFLQESDDNSNYTTFMNVTDLDIDGGQALLLTKMMTTLMSCLTCLSTQIEKDISRSLIQVAREEQGKTPLRAVLF